MTDLLTAPAPAAAPAAPRPVVGRTLLLPQDRIAREALAAAAARLNARLRDARRGLRRRRDLALAVSGAANNAALVAAHRGDRQTAWEMCQAHLRWQSRFGRRSRDPAITGHALQPWINLGRLEAIAGRGERALERFARLRGWTAGTAMELGTGRVAPDGWRVIGETAGEFGRFVERVYVVESLKALLLTRCDAALPAFAGGLGDGLPPALARLVDEAVIVAAAGAGDVERARETALRCTRASSGWTRMVFQLRLGETLAVLGDTAGAHAALGPVLQAGVRLHAGLLRDLQTLYVLTRAAAAGDEAGLHDAAAALARATLAGARDAGDQCFELASLRVLTHAAPPEDRPRWRAGLAALEAATEYARERRGPAAPPSPEIQTLYQLTAETLNA